jgi:hypothetical protein
LVAFDFFGDRDEAFEFADDVGPSGLVRDFGDALLGVVGELFGDAHWRSGDGRDGDGVPTPGGPGRVVGLVESAEVLVVHGEVAFVLGLGVDDLEPALSAG